MTRSVLAQSTSERAARERSGNQRREEEAWGRTGKGMKRRRGTLRRKPSPQHRNQTPVTVEPEPVAPVAAAPEPNAPVAVEQEPVVPVAALVEGAPDSSATDHVPPPSPDLTELSRWPGPSTTAAKREGPRPPTEPIDHLEPEYPLGQILQELSGGQLEKWSSHLDMVVDGFMDWFLVDDPKVRNCRARAHIRGLGLKNGAF